MYPVSLTADLSVFFSYKIKNESTAALKFSESEEKLLTLQTFQILILIK
jgi:hypothetical protein